MAPSAKHLSFFFLIFFISSLTQIHARESKFFSKFNFHQHMSTSTTTSSNNAKTKVVPFGGEEEPRFSTRTEVRLSPSSAPAYPPDTYTITPATFANPPAVVATPPDTYGSILTPTYAPDIYANSPTPASAPAIYAEAPTSPAYAPDTGSSHGFKESEMEFSEDNFNSYNNNNEGKTENLGLGEKRLIGNDEIRSNYNSKYGEMNNEELRNNLFGRKQQGMSDTRSVENGRYFYNLDKETYPVNKYQPTERTGDTSNNFYDGEYKTQQFDLGGGTLRETREDNNNYHGGDNVVSRSQPRREKQGMSDTRFMENGRYFYNPNMEANQHNEYQPRESIGNVGEHKAQQFDAIDAILRENGDDDEDEENMDNVVGKNQAQQMERKGTSDTRFLENDRYFNDPSNVNYNANGGKPVGEDHQGVFGSTRGMNLRSEENKGNYYVNNADEFDNAEEEYRHQEGNPEEYQP
ncbi:hypothetical protein Scep_011421 [Stephania cephalantha]|uniref:Protein E6-like n=1 Tax=Stephania cephalantha TaxID=152367 RepID=A0AAP0JDB7_9MAGN